LRPVTGSVNRSSTRLFVPSPFFWTVQLRAKTQPPPDASFAKTSEHRHLRRQSE
jgi:hypothetical protein